MGDCAADEAGERLPSGSAVVMISGACRDASGVSGRGSSVGLMMGMGGKVGVGVVMMRWMQRVQRDKYAAGEQENY